MTTKFEITGHIEWEETRQYHCRTYYDMMVEANSAEEAIAIVRKQYFTYSADDEEYTSKEKDPIRIHLDARLENSDDPHLWAEEMERRRLAEEKQNLAYMEQYSVPLFSPSQMAG